MAQNHTDAYSYSLEAWRPNGWHGAGTKVSAGHAPPSLWGIICLLASSGSWRLRYSSAPGHCVTFNVHPPSSVPTIGLLLVPRLPLPPLHKDTCVHMRGLRVRQRILISRSLAESCLQSHCAVEGNSFWRLGPGCRWVIYSAGHLLLDLFKPLEVCSRCLSFPI